MRSNHYIVFFSSKIVAIFSLWLVMGHAAFAQNNVEDAQLVQSKLEQLVGPGEVESVSETQYPGVYLFTNRSGGITFVHLAGDLLLVGSGYDVDQKKDVLNELRNKKITDAVSGLSSKDFIEIGPKDAQRYISVFTDIDCGYCRKLHFEVVSELAEKGVKTRYIMWPRSGLNTKSHEKAVTAFCSEDREKAMDILKGGQDLPKVECDNPVADLFTLGKRIGINGTPTIITDNNEVVPGYVPAQQLLSIMEIE